MFTAKIVLFSTAALFCFSFFSILLFAFSISGTETTEEKAKEKKWWHGWWNAFFSLEGILIFLIFLSFNMGKLINENNMKGQSLVIEDLQTEKYYAAIPLPEDTVKNSYFIYQLAKDDNTSAGSDARIITTTTKLPENFFLNSDGKILENNVEP